MARVGCCCWSVLFLGAWLLSLVAASRDIPESFAEDYTKPEVLPPSPDYITFVEDYPEPYVHPPSPDSMERTSLDQVLDPFASVYLHASSDPGGAIPDIHILVGCSCSNGTQIPRFFLTPDSTYQIVGAGDTTWTCKFFWSAPDQNFYVQEFAVYAPPSNFYDWAIDTKGFNLLQSSQYVHIHDWIQSPEMSPQK